MIYTVKLDYYATGEGRTQMILVGYYENESKAKQRFADVFDPYFAQGCSIIEGINIDDFEHIVHNSLIKLLLDNEDHKSST